MTAFNGYSDTVLARTSGGGYCKRSAALSSALNKKYGLELGGWGAGIEVVIKLAKEQGLTVYDNYAVTALIYKQK